MINAKCPLAYAHPYLIRNQWRQIFLVTKDKSLSPIQLTPDGVDVVDFAGYDAISGTVYYIASPFNPLRRYLYGVQLDGTGNKRITPEDEKWNGTNGYSVSEDGKFAIHSFSSITCPLITQIIRLPGHEVI